MGTIATNLGIDLLAAEAPRSLVLGGYVFEKTNLYPMPIALTGDYSAFYSVGGFRYSVYSGRILNSDRAKVKHYSTVVDDKLELFVGSGYVFDSNGNKAIIPDLSLNSYNGYASVRFATIAEPDSLQDSLSLGYRFSTGITGNVISFSFTEVSDNVVLINAVVEDTYNKRYAYIGTASYDTDRNLSTKISASGYLSAVPLKYLGKNNSVYYFGGLFLVDGSIKLGIVSFDSSSYSASIDYYDLSSSPDYSAFNPAICGVYREDGSIYVPVLYRDSNGWNGDVFLINVSDNSVGNLGWSLDTSSVDISNIVPASGSYGWASDVALSSGKGALVHSLYLDMVLAPPVYGNSYDFVITLFLDETNGKLAVKDAKSYDASVARGVMPINKGKSSFYVLGDRHISLLKIDGDGVLIYEDVDRAVDILGIDELGRIWGADSLRVELLPIYEPYRKVEISFQTPLSVSDSFPVDNSLVVKLYDENGNRIAGSVELVVTSGNMLFKDNNSYKITVSVSDGTNGDTTVPVSITAAGEINVEGVVL